MRLQFEVEVGKKTYDELEKYLTGTGYRGNIKISIYDTYKEYFEISDLQVDRINKSKRKFEKIYPRQ